MTHRGEANAGLSQYYNGTGWVQEPVVAEQDQGNWTGAVSLNFATLFPQKFALATLTGDATLSLTFGQVGHTQLRVITGAYTLTVSGVTWLGEAPTLTGGTWLITFFYNGTTTWGMAALAV